MRRLCGAALLFVAAACGGGDPGEVSAAVVMDGESFEFVEPCRVGNQGTLWAAEGVDRDRPFGISVTWTEGQAEPGTVYEAPLGEPVDLLIMRPVPDGAWARVSTVEAGTVTFTAVGHDSGDEVSGAFDDVVLTRDEPDDQVMITVTAGSFRCAVP